MLSPVTQVAASPQIPLALLQKPVQDWLPVPSGDPKALEAVAERPLSQIPLQLLRRLAVDDRLRAELEADPAGTLARHGIHVAGHQIPMAVCLPDVEALGETLKAHATDEDESRVRYWLGWIGILTGDD